MHASSRPIYDNFSILAPDEQFLGRCDASRADFYLSNGLADQVDIKTIRLRFEPSGREGINDPFYLEPRANKCVVCGSTTDLTKHHIVPSCYRRFMPHSIKSHSSHDIVALCIPCHERYESAASELREQMDKEFGFAYRDDGKLVGEALCKNRAAKYARTLLKYRDELPAKRIVELVTFIKSVYDEFTLDDNQLRSVISKNPTKRGHKRAFLETRVPQADLQRIIVRWRQHFLNVMQPRFMTPHWDVGRATR